MEIKLIYNGLLKLIKEIRKRDNKNYDLLTEFIIAINKITEIGTDLLEKNDVLKNDELNRIKDYYAFLEGYLEGLVKSINEINWLVKKLKCPNCNSFNVLFYDEREKVIKCNTCKNILTTTDLF